MFDITAIVYFSYYYSHDHNTNSCFNHFFFTLLQKQGCKRKFTGEFILISTTKTLQNIRKISIKKNCCTISNFLRYYGFKKSNKKN